MDRAILGKGTTNTTSEFYHRTNKFGVYISKPGMNVHNCSDGDLLFDSTATGQLSPVKSGTATVGKRVYHKGIFGFEGAINENNWNSPGGEEPKEVNADTSWLFDAMAGVAKDLESIQNDYVFVNESAISNVAQGLLNSLNLGNVGDEEFVRSMCKDLWRINEVFPFFSGATDLLGTTIDSPNGGPLDTSVRAWYNVANTGIQTTADMRKVLPKVFRYLQKNNLNAEMLDLKSNYSFVNSDWAPTNPDDVLLIYNPWRFWWNVYASFAYKYSEKTAYSGEAISYDNPAPWRAWTTPETGKYSEEQEKAAALRFYKIMFLLRWAYFNFGEQIKTGAIDFEKTYTFDSVDYHDTFNISSGFSDPTIFTYGENYTNTYTYWSSGKIEIPTGVTPKDENKSPLFVLWVPKLKNLNDMSTNLPFLANQREFIKTGKQSATRKFQLKPGLAAVQANTFFKTDYLGNSELILSFEQPSTEDEVDVSYTIFRQVAHQERVFDAGSTSLTVSTTGTVGKAPQEDVIYTLVFPDDFVGAKFSSDDPFRDKRDSQGRINQKLYVTIDIEDGVIISGNSFNNHINVSNLVNSGTNSFGPKDIAASPTTERLAVVDPCIKINLSSDEWTSYAVSGLQIDIVNEGKIYGAGGWGAYGQSTHGTLNLAKFFDIVNQGVEEYNLSGGGGGGGGGQGYHPTWTYEDSIDDYNVSGFSGTANAVEWSVGHPSEFVPPKVTINIFGVDIDFWVSNDPLYTFSESTGSLFYHNPKGLQENNGYYNVNLPEERSYMSLVTWNSIKPGLPGTGYMGSLGLDAPYVDLNNPNIGQMLQLNYAGYKMDQNQAYANAIYHQTGVFTWPFLSYPAVDSGWNYVYGIIDDGNNRIAGSSIMGWTQESAAQGWGNPGKSGTRTDPGDGGEESFASTNGQSHYAYARYDVRLGSRQGLPGAGSGGSCVYVYSDMDTSGTKIKLINQGNGEIKSGGGGGSSGVDQKSGVSGGKMGRPGDYPAGTDISENVPSEYALDGDGTTILQESSGYGFGFGSSLEHPLFYYTRRGEPGRLVWWNSNNPGTHEIIDGVVYTDTITSSIEGLEMNTEIGGEDYVSYRNNEKTYSRKLDGSTVVYTEMGEKTYNEWKKF